MIRKIVIDGIVTAILLALLAWIFSMFNPGGFVYIHMPLNVWPIIVVGLLLGIINALLVPLAMRFFRRSTGILLFVITLVIDAAALMLTHHFSSNFYTNWPSALIIAAILSVVGPLVLGKSK